MQYKICHLNLFPSPLCFFLSFVLSFVLFLFSFLLLSFLFSFRLPFAQQPFLCLEVSV